jgi:hypothetical protein
VSFTLTQFQIHLTNLNQCLSVESSMCAAGFGLRQGFARPALLMLGAAGAFMRVGKKLS